MSKLTLSVDSEVIARARSFARRQGTSISKLVETYLASVNEPQGRDVDPPALRSVRGILKSAKLEGYRRHLEKKYR